MNQKYLDKHHPRWKSFYETLLQDRSLQRLIDSNQNDVLRNFQLILDLSKNVEGGIPLRRIAKKESIAACKKELDQYLVMSETENFIELLKTYYRATAMAKLVIGKKKEDSILRLCGKHPPRKSKLLLPNLCSILRVSEDQLDLSADTQLSYSDIGLDKAVGKRAADAQKDYGNELAELIRILAYTTNQELKKKYKDIEKLVKDCKSQALKIATHLALPVESTSKFESVLALLNYITF